MTESALPFFTLSFSLFFILFILFQPFVSFLSFAAIHVTVLRSPEPRKGKKMENERNVNNTKLEFTANYLLSNEE